MLLEDGIESAVEERSPAVDDDEGVGSVAELESTPVDELSTGSAVELISAPVEEDGSWADAVDESRTSSPAVELGMLLSAVDEDTT